jgi:uncharacterized membrane protein
MLPSSWKRDFASGLIVISPLLVTAYIIAWLYNRLARIPSPFPGEVYGSARLAELMGVVTRLAIFAMLGFSVGVLRRTARGDIVEESIDDVMNQLPGLRIVYNASKMAVETALSGTEQLQRPVKLEVWNGLRMTAFKTGKQTNDGRDVLFLPTSPNITTGYVIEVEPDEYEEIDERVEDALTRILSAGFGESRDQTIPIDVIDERAGDGETVTNDDD